MARVHPAQELFGGFATAKWVHAAQLDDHGKFPRFKKIELCVDELGPKCRFLGLELRLADLVGQLHRFKHKIISRIDSERSGRSLVNAWQSFSSIRGICKFRDDNPKANSKRMRELSQAKIDRIASG